MENKAAELKKTYLAKQSTKPDFKSSSTQTEIPMIALQEFTNVEKKLAEQVKANEELQQKYHRGKFNEFFRTVTNCH